MFEHRKHTYKRIGYEIVSHESQNRPLLRAFESLTPLGLEDNANSSDVSNSQAPRINTGVGCGGATSGDSNIGVRADLDDMSSHNTYGYFENITL